MKCSDVRIQSKKKVLNLNILAQITNCNSLDMCEMFGQLLLGVVDVLVQRPRPVHVHCSALATKISQMLFSNLTIIKLVFGNN